jgi:SAM-dependent methyltransferase
MAVEDMNFEEGSFDLVIGSAILHHTDLKMAVPNIFRVLKQGGRAIFIEPLNENYILKFWRKLTPSRRSPMERALLKGDLYFIRSVFRKRNFRYYGLTSILSMGLMMFYPQRTFIKVIDKVLGTLDSHVAIVYPKLCPYFSVCVMELLK